MSGVQYRPNPTVGGVGAREFVDPHVENVRLCLQLWIVIGLSTHIYDGCFKFALY